MTTTFDTPSGTRGASTHVGPFYRWLERQMERPAVRALFESLGMGRTCVLTTTGRRSGLDRSVRVCYFPTGDDGWLVVAAAGGTATNPAWYHNIAAHPDRVWITVDGHVVRVSARQLHGQERAIAWQRVVTTSRQFAGFQRRTDRELPVILLRPLATCTSPPWPVTR